MGQETLDLEELFTGLGEKPMGQVLSEVEVSALLDALPSGVQAAVRSSISYAMATENLGAPGITVRQARVALLPHTKGHKAVRGVSGADKLAA